MSNVDLDKSGRIPQINKVFLGPTVGWRYIDKPLDIEFVINGGGSQISAGVKGNLAIPEWVTVWNWVMVSDQAGSIQIDVWKLTQAQALAGTLPAVANTITGTDKPRLVAQSARQSFLLTGWNTLIDQNDQLYFNVDALSTLFRVTLVLQCYTLKGPV